MWRRDLLLWKPDDHLVFNAVKFQVRTGVVFLKERWSGGGGVTAILGTSEPASGELSSVQKRHQQTGMSLLEGDQDG